MNPHEINLLHVVHVAAVVVLIAYTFLGFAGAPETRKRVLIMTGIASLLVLLTGIRMWQGMFGFGMAAWLIVKVVCWLGLSALTGVAYRKPDKVNALTVIVLALAVVALVMVYYRPGA
jgi:hypothetical protein